MAAALYFVALTVEIGTTMTPQVREDEVEEAEVEKGGCV
jgi:hypothetical protein